MTGVSNEIQNPNLEVVLLKRTFVLPWSQFLFAEGGNEEIRLAFSTHDVVVIGCRLDKLLEDLSARRLSRLQEPGKADRFGSSVGLQITSISVQKVD
jgi:hypothetical protein